MSGYLQLDIHYALEPCLQKCGEFSTYFRIQHKRNRWQLQISMHFMLVCLYIINFTQFFQDWHMVLIAMVVTGISMCLVTLATAVTTIKQFVVKIQNIENPKGIAVSLFVY